MRRISLKGVAIGSITDILATYVVMIPLILYVAVSPELPPVKILMESSVIHVSSLILGGACSVLGGYVAARIAKHDELLNGALSSILCVGGGLYVLISGGAADDLWRHLFSLPLSPALGALGGYLRQQQAARLA